MAILENKQTYSIFCKSVVSYVICIMAILNKKTVQYMIFVNQ